MKYSVEALFEMHEDEDEKSNLHPIKKKINSKKKPTDSISILTKNSSSYL
jgi:hypothetical protein